MTDNDKKLEAALRQIQDGYISAAMAKAGANAKLLMPHVRDRVALELANGRLEPRVLDDRRAVRIDADDVPVSLDTLMSEMARDKDFAPAFGTPGDKSKPRRTAVGLPEKRGLTAAAATVKTRKNNIF